MRYRSYIILLLFYVTAVHLAFAAVFESNTFRLEFDVTGKVSSFVYKPLGRELVTGTYGNDGFIVYDLPGGATVNLTNVTRTPEGNLLAVSTDSQYQVLFTVSENDNDITFRIESLQGFDPPTDVKLRFKVRPVLTGSTFAGSIPAIYGDGVGVGILSLDYMTWSLGSFTVEWRYLWHRNENPSDPLGGFAIFACEESQTLDTIGQIEQAESLPNPIYGGQWAKQNNNVARLTEMYIGFSGDVEKNKAVDYCEQAGIGVLYIPQSVWESGSPYTVNTSNWPNGKDSLRDFSELLNSKGILLGIHTGSCSLWNSDKVYVKPIPDSRLASWGSGRLAQSVSETDTDIYFLPDAGTVIPSNTNETHGLRPPVYHEIWGWEKIQIGNEIIKVGSYDDTTVPWHLSGCVRAQEGTAVSSYDADAVVKGLLTVYGHLAVDPDSSLLQEIADKMTDLVNYCQVSRLSFDAIETIESSGRWGMNKYMTKAYEGFEHFVATDSSSGLPQYEWHVAAFANNGEPMHFYPKAYFENDLIGNANENFVPEGLGAITFRKDSRINAWHASSPDEWQWWLAKAAAYDATYWFWTTVGELDGNGQTPDILNLCSKWEQIKLYNVLTDAQKGLLKDYDKSFRLTLYDPNSPTWEITPVDISTPVFSQADGSSVSVSNPNGPQPLRFEARVLPDYDYAAVENEKITPDTLEDYDIDAGLTVTKSGNKFTLSSSSSSPLQANWSCPTKDLSNKRGVGLYVTGYWLGGYVYIEYASGSKYRQYIIPNNVAGLRYVEIPDFEVADYLYRDEMYNAFQNPYGTIRQGFRYNAIDRISIGLTGVPQGTTALIAVESVKSLSEIETRLTDFDLETSTGSKLTVNGNINSGHYIVYEGGNTAEILDPNRNFVEDLAVTLTNWDVPSGLMDISINTNITNKPWMKILFKTLGTPFSLPNPEDSDLNDDGVVNIMDLNILAGDWLKGEVVLPGDLNRNNRVDLEDFSWIASDWFE